MRQSPAAIASSSSASQISRSEGREATGRLVASGTPVNGGLLVNGGLSVNGGAANGGRAPLSSTGVSSRGVLLPVEGLYNVSSAAGRHNNAAAVEAAANAAAIGGGAAAVATARPTISSALTSQDAAVHRTASNHGLVSSALAIDRAASRHLEVGEGRVVGSVIAATTISSTGLGRQAPSQQRQALHSKPALAASSSPRRSVSPRDADAVDHPLLPVRQTLGHVVAIKPNGACSLSAVHLAVFGLVSMLLIVGFTSLLQKLQLPPSSSSSSLFAHLLPSSASSSLVILSLLSTLSPLNTAKSIPSGMSFSSSRRGRHHLARTAGVARVPVACF